jgi:hypothetical protein
MLLDVEGYHRKGFTQGPIRKERHNRYAQAASYLIVLKKFSPSFNVVAFMNTFTTWISRHLPTVLGLSGATLCLSVFFLTGNALGQQGSAPVVEKAMEQSGQAGAEAKPQRWTILCEREDGSQGVFRVSSKLTDKPEPLEPTLPVETHQATQDSPAPEIEDEPSSMEEDPFGDPALKCGRLMTLLAFFGRQEFSTP